MKKNWDHLEKFRVVTGEGATDRGMTCGAFRFPSGGGKNEWFEVAADNGVHTTWECITIIRRTIKGRNTSVGYAGQDALRAARLLFWEDDEVVIQYHDPAPNPTRPKMLMLWKPRLDLVPVPPKAIR